MISKITEEHSRRIFWGIQVILGFVIGRSFYASAELFIPPFHHEILTTSIAIASVYFLVISNWIDFSFSLIVSPYQFNTDFGRIRFVLDIFLLFGYSYLLLYLEYIRANPFADHLIFFSISSLIFLGYLFSGLLRRIQYGDRSSKTEQIIVSFVSIVILAIAYAYANQFQYDKAILNRTFFSLFLILLVVFQLVRKTIGKRKHKIGIDVDGVLANQIAGILPVIKKDLDLDITYQDVTDWKFPLKTTSIDKVIMNEQKHRGYIINMPIHSGAKLAIDLLIKRHYIFIATARPPETDDWTKEWLARNKIQYDSYFNLKEGFKHNIDFDILIDDYPGNLLSFLEKHHGSAILFSQPWNKDLGKLQSYVDNGRLFVAYKWQDILPITSKILRRPSI